MADESGSESVVGRHTSSWRAVAMSGLLHASIIAAVVLLTVRSASAGGSAPSNGAHYASIVLLAIALTLLLFASYKNRRMRPLQFGLAVAMLGVIILSTNGFVAGESTRPMWTWIGVAITLVGAVFLGIALYAVRSGSSKGDSPSAP